MADLVSNDLVARLFLWIDLLLKVQYVVVTVTRKADHTVRVQSVA